MSNKRGGGIHGFRTPVRGLALSVELYDLLPSREFGEARTAAEQHVNDNAKRGIVGHS